MNKRLAVMMPVYNEEPVLQENVEKLLSFLENNIEIGFVLQILDSDSTDGTARIAHQCAGKNSRVGYMNIHSPGKGGKIKHFVLHSDFDYYAFIDADLPIGLERFRVILDAVMKDGADLAIASRYIGGGKSHRRMSRNIASKAYNRILNVFRILPVRDAFAGAKCWNAGVKRSVWPKVKDREWFFDTELIYHALKRGLVVREIPVVYNDLRKDSKLHAFRDGMKIGKALLKFILTRER